MSPHLDRRRILAAASGLGAFALAGRSWPAAASQSSATVSATAVDAAFPRQPAAAVRETVGVSHGNLERVEELVGARPQLAKAAVDWGFGDWETALGAAAHTGSREIALLLIGHGARPTLFSAAMLGQLDVVRAFVEASPGVQGTLGPHSITLLSHAKAGGESSASVREYLESVGGADSHPGVSLDAEERARLLGVYRFGTGSTESLEVIERRDALMIQRSGGLARGLVHLGDYEFYPAGAESVRVTFALEAGVAVAVTVHDPQPLVTGRRAG